MKIVLARIDVNKIKMARIVDEAEKTTNLSIEEDATLSIVVYFIKYMSADGWLIGLKKEVCTLQLF